MRRRWTSWSSFRAMGWSQGSVLAQALNSSWVHLLKRALKHSWPIGRWCRILSMSNRTAIGTEYSTMDCKELTILNSVTDQNWNESNLVRVGLYRLFQRTWLVERHHVGTWPREETLGGAPHGYTFFPIEKRSWREWVIGPRNRWIRWNRAERSHFMLGAVIMDCRGLVDPQNKPFGNVLPLEIQIKIMF